MKSKLLRAGLALSVAVALGSPAISTAAPAISVKASVAKKLTVRFDAMSSHLDARDKLAIRHFVKKNSSATSFDVKGYVQRSNSASNDKSLSKARAKVVRNYLRTRGVETPIYVHARKTPAKDAGSWRARRAVITASYAKISGGSGNTDVNPDPDPSPSNDHPTTIKVEVTQAAFNLSKQLRAYYTDDNEQVVFGEITNPPIFLTPATGTHDVSIVILYESTDFMDVSLNGTSVCPFSVPANSTYTCSNVQAGDTITIDADICYGGIRATRRITGDADTTRRTGCIR